MIGITRLSTAGLMTLVVLAGGLMTSSPASAAAPEKPLTKPATEIGGTAATLHGVLNPKASATAGYHFTYGSEGSCEGNTTEARAEATGKAIKVSTPLTGLTPHTKYTFCVVATNVAEESTTGSPLSFETLPVPPAIEEESASAITRSTVSLSALINPEFQETICKAFQYVDHAGFITSEFAGALEVPCEPEGLGAGSSGERTTANLTGLTANTTYHYRVLTENASGLSQGTGQTFLTLPNPPEASTGEASSITPNSATIAGTVIPGSEGPNSETTYLFQYGTTTSYSTQQPLAPGDAGEGTSPIAETASLTALEPGTTYHYRILATNDNTNVPQTAFGKDETFTTVATPPILIGVSASNVTQSTATITATLDPRGLPTRYELQLGRTPGALQAEAFGNTAGAGVISLTLSVGSLSPGTLYYYRLNATNLNGTAELEPEGAFMTVVGLDASSPLAQPPRPPLLATPAIAFPTESATGGGVLGTTKRQMTNAQKLASALKTCRKKPRKVRASCERQARRRFGARKKGKPTKK